MPQQVVQVVHAVRRGPHAVVELGHVGWGEERLLGQVRVGHLRPHDGQLRLQEAGRHRHLVADRGVVEQVGVGLGQQRCGELAVPVGPVVSHEGAAGVARQPGVHLGEAAGGPLEPVAQGSVGDGALEVG